MAEFLLRSVSEWEIGLVKDSANYPGKEKGGERPICKPQGLASGDKEITKILSRVVSKTGSQAAPAAIAAGPCTWLTPAESLPVAACRRARLLLADSSISALIACRSSEAEITGNNRTSTHPRASRHCGGLAMRGERVVVPRRHTQYAGRASNTHARLSRSSMPGDCTCPEHTTQTSGATQFFRNHNFKST